MKKLLPVVGKQITLFGPYTRTHTFINAELTHVGVFYFTVKLFSGAFKQIPIEYANYVTIE